jgi:hypothetical protein
LENRKKRKEGHKYTYLESQNPFFLVKRPWPFFGVLRLWSSGATCGRGATVFFTSFVEQIRFRDW